MNKILFILLSKLINPGWAAEAFRGLREGIAGQSGAIKNIAIGIASFIFVVQLIKMYRDLVSDEQHGGFGGISSKQILRPVLVFILIILYPSVITVFDQTIAKVSSSIEANIPAAKFSEATVAVENSNGMTKKEMKEEAREKAIEEAKEFFSDDEDALKKINNIEKENSSKWKRFWGNNQVVEANTTLTLEDAQKNALAYYGYTYNQEFERLKTADRRRGNLSRYLGTTKNTGSIIGGIAKWIFNILCFLLQIVGNLMLCMLSFFGPIAIALSMVSKWEGAVYGFIAQYVQISLWMPLLALLKYSVITFMNSGFETLANKICEALSGSTTLSSDETVSSVRLVGSLVWVAGAYMVTKIPGMASSLLQIGGGDGGGGAVAGAVAGGAVSGAKGAINAGKTAVKAIGERMAGKP